MFRVGPESAGADPGPVCYGHGGTQPTVTDALAVLGWLVPEALLGGRMRLDVAAARRAVERLGQTLALSADETALGIVRIALHHMVNAIELHSVRKGYDPREAVLVALGGAGPMLGAHIAEHLGIPQVVVPPHPGIGSAIGLLSSDLRYERSATVWERTEPEALTRLQTIFDALAADARAEFARDGLTTDEVAIERHLECRYVGQGYELRIAAPGGPCDEAWLADLVESFHAAHERERMRRMPDLAVQIVNVSITAVGVLPRMTPGSEAGVSGAPPSPQTECDAIFERDEAPVAFRAPRYRRDDLGAGAELRGPCIVDQLDTTVVVPPGWRARAHGAGHLVLDRGAQEVSDGHHHA